MVGLDDLMGLSNLNDSIISIGLGFLAWSPLLHCSCALYWALCNTEKSRYLCDREVEGFHFHQILLHRPHTLSQPPCRSFYGQDIPVPSCCSCISGQKAIKASVV